MRFTCLGIYRVKFSEKERESEYIIPERMGENQAIPSLPNGGSLERETSE